MRSNMAWLTLAVGSLFWSPCLRADGVDLKGEGAFGFPQARAQVLCDRENLRVSAWSNSEYLYVQAIVWADDDEHGGEINGREYHDYSTIDFDLDGDKARTRLVDRTYSLNIPGSPGLHGSVVMTERGGAAGREHSAGRGLIKYVQNVDGKKVRVDSFLIPLAEIEKKTGDTVRFSYWTRSPKPEFVANSVGFESDKLYFWHGLPVDKFHEYKLLDSGAFDQNALPAEPETPAETTVTRPAVAAAPTLTIGSRAPALAIEHWVQDGQGQFKPITEFDPGKVYIVEFWATWCGPCIAAMPHIADLQKTYADQGLQVISISDETLDVVEKFLERKVPAQKDKEGKEPKEITYRELTNAYCLTTDPDRSNHDNYMKAAGQNGIPRAFIVGKDGHIEWIGHPMSIDKALASVIEGNWDRALYAAEFKEGEEFSRKLRDIMSLAYAGKFDSARKELSEAGDAASSATIKERVPTLLRTISRIEVEKLILQNSDEAVAKLEAFLEGQLPEEVNNVVWNFIVEATEKGRNVRPEILASALRLTDKAVQATPEDSYLLDTHAHVLQLNGKLEQAIEFQEKAVKLTDERSRQDVVNYLEKLRGLKDPQYVPKPHVKKVSELRRLEGHTNKATYVTFSPDGKTLLSSSDDKTVRLWDVESGKELKSFQGHQSMAMCAVFTPDAAHYLSCSGWPPTSGNHSLRYSSIEGKELWKGEHHKDTIWKVSISTDGQRALTASRDSTIGLWNVQTGELMKELVGHTAWVRQAVFVPNQDLAVSASWDKSIRIWDLTTGKEIRRIDGHKAEVQDVQVSSDGKWIASCSNPQPRSIFQVFQPDEPTVRIWDLQTGAEVRRMATLPGRQWTIAIAPDGRTILSGGDDKVIRLWDAQTGHLLANLEGHTDTVRRAAYSPDGRLVASASHDATIRLWKLPEEPKADVVEPNTTSPTPLTHVDTTKNNKLRGVVGMKISK